MRCQVILLVAVLVSCGKLGETRPPWAGNPPPPGLENRQGPPENPPPWDNQHIHEEEFGHDEPLHTFVMDGCKLRNETSNTDLYSKPCGCGSPVETETASCDLGPLRFPGYCNETLSLTFCKVAPDWSKKKPWRGALSKACLIKAKGSTTVYKSSKCEGNKPCTLGPISYTVNGTEAEVFFCQSKTNNGNQQRCMSVDPPPPVPGDCVCLTCLDPFDPDTQFPELGRPGDGPLPGPDPPQEGDNPEFDPVDLPSWDPPPQSGAIFP